jgi:hypothetical protein
MSNKMILNIGNVEIKSNSHIICLNSDKYFKEVPQNIDISSIKLLNLENTNYIEEVIISIGGQYIFRYSIDEFNDMFLSDLPESGILLSKLKYHTVNIEFKFKSNFMTDNALYGEEDEYDEEIIVHDKEPMIEIEDLDGDIYTGYRIERVKKYIGKKITSYPQFKLPDIEIEFKPAIESMESIICTPIWQRVLINPNTYKWDTIEHLIKKYELNTYTNKPVLESYEEKKPFYARMKNTIRYMNGLACLTHCL